MVTLYIFIMRLYGMKQLENKNNGIVVSARFKLLAGHERHTVGRMWPAGCSLPTPVLDKSTK